MTAIEYTIYEQPQSPGSHSPGLENPTPGKPILENPTPGNPTSENPTQLNKDISKTNLPNKEKSNTDLSSTHSIPIHSLNPLPYSEGAAEPPEKKRTERNDAYRVYEEIIKDNIDYHILIQDMACRVEDEFFSRPDFMERIIDVFRQLKRFADFTNETIDRKSVV